MTSDQLALAAFLGALTRALAGASAVASDKTEAAAIGQFAELTRAIDTTSEPTPPIGVPERIPVFRFWDAALSLGRSAEPDVVGDLISALERLGPALVWTQNPNYRRQPPDAGFLDRYGYAVIAGPADGPPALATDPLLAVGVLLLGPGAHYPLHRHPAVEVYYTLTPGGEWWRGEGPWRRERAGIAIYHPPGLAHATRTGADPLLAVYLWRGDLGTHARLEPHGVAGH